MTQRQSSTTLPKYALCQEFYLKEAHKGERCFCFDMKPSKPIPIPKPNYTYCWQSDPVAYHNNGPCMCFGTHYV